VRAQWRDVHDQRFDALQRWAAAFEAAQGKKPLLWLDKACLNWDDIESSLQCLPLFLSGCHQFVVLAGSVYTTRMWYLGTLVPLARALVPKTGRRARGHPPQCSCTRILPHRARVLIGRSRRRLR